MSHVLRRTLAVAAALCAAVSATCVPGVASAMTVTQVNVYLGGTSADWLVGGHRWLADGFDNGQPLLGPVYAGGTTAASWQLSALAPGATVAQAVQESGSALHLDPAFGATAANAVGLSGPSLRLRLMTSVSDPAASLSLDQAFSVSARLSLADLPGVGETQGIRLSDSFSNANDYVELFLQGTDTGTRIVLREQDFLLGTVTALGSAWLQPVSGAAQVVLSLSHGTAGSTAIFGSYNYADASGALLAPSFTGLGVGSAFDGETATRLELRATALAAAVPEPSAAVLMAGGLLLVGAVRRRRA